MKMSLSNILKPSKTSQFRQSCSSIGSFRGKKAQQMSKVKRALNSNNHSSCSSYQKRRKRFNQTVRMPSFRKIMKNKGKISDCLTKELSLPPDGQLKSMYESQFQNGKCRPVSRHNNNPINRVSKAGRQNKYPTNFNRYGGVPKPTNSRVKLRENFKNKYTGYIAENDPYRKVPGYIADLLDLDDDEKKEQNDKEGEGKDDKEGEEKEEVDNEEGEAKEDKDQEEKAPEDELDELDRQIIEYLSQTDAEKSNSNFYPSLESQISNIEEIRAKLIQKYPVYFRSNKEYFKNLMTRTTKELPIDFLFQYRNSPLQSLQMKSKFIFQSQYMNEFNKRNSQGCAKTNSLDARYYTQGMRKANLDGRTAYNDEFQSKGQVYTEHYDGLHRVPPFPFLNKTSYQNQYLNYGKILTMQIKAPHVKHVIKEMPFYEKTENKEQFHMKKQDKHEEGLNKLAKAKFYKKTRIYSNSGAFEKKTTNQSTYQGKQNKFRNLPANYKQYTQTPSYLRQYESQEKQTYQNEQYKNYDKAKKTRLKRVKRMLEIMKQFSQNKTRKLQASYPKMREVLKKK